LQCILTTEELLEAVTMRTLPLLLTLVLLLMAGCELGTATDPCADVSCEEWASCQAGECLPLAGRCSDYLDCAPDEYCDGTHTCQGPIVPDATFLDEGSGNRLTFGIQGLIQQYETLDEGSVTLARGGLEATVDGTSEALDYSVYAFRYTVPETSSLELLRGQDVIGVAGSHVREEGVGIYRYTYGMVLVPVTALQAMRAGDTPEAAAPASLFASLRDVTATRRAFDQAVFTRYCPVAYSDADGDGSRLFADAHRNANFAVGEDALLWGNLALGARAEVTEANEATLCTFYQNGQLISRADYLAGLAQTEPELSCEVPEGFLGPSSPSWFTVFFTGLINDPDVPMASWTHGLGDLEAVLDGEAFVVDDSYLLAYLWDQGTPLLVAQSLGDVEELGTNHYRFHLVQLALGQAWLAEMKAAGETIRTYDPDWTYVTLWEYEQKVVGPDDWYKQCPILTHDPASSAGSVLVCSDQNTDFSPGEPWDVAAVIPATGDATTILAVNAMTEPCACSTSTGLALDCATFDAE
jgi:hypothetical protein